MAYPLNVTGLVGNLGADAQAIEVSLQYTTQWLLDVTQRGLAVDPASQQGLTSALASAFQVAVAVGLSTTDPHTVAGVMALSRTFCYDPFGHMTST